MSKPWSGRFTKETERLVEEFGASLPFDRRLYAEDITGSIAHARMLARQKIITPQEGETLLRGLRQVYQEIEAGEFAWDVADEDIHMAVERRLHEVVGETAGKLHTARSRNDQVATDMRLYTKRLCAETDRGLQKLQQALIGLAEDHTGAILPGYTHIQRAQPVLLAHHLLAYVEMLERDRDRFADCLRRADVCPLGAAALAGTTFPIDRQWVAEELGFAGVSRNSLDAVSDRDFVVDYLSAAALAMVHLSRLAEEIVLWSSGEFGFITLDDGYSTGSSIMPQKKNPDIAELVRGKSGRVFGHLMALLTTLKALPLAYNKDMQEDKEGFFDAADTLRCLPGGHDRRGEHPDGERGRHARRRRRRHDDRHRPGRRPGPPRPALPPGPRRGRPPGALVPGERPPARRPAPRRVPHVLAPLRRGGGPRGGRGGLGAGAQRLRRHGAGAGAGEADGGAGTKWCVNA